MPGQRRDRLDLQHRSELSIRRAIIEVEVIGPNPKLDEAIQLLKKAQTLVSDYIDSLVTNAENYKHL